jgi:hypothetical protein
MQLASVNSILCHAVHSLSSPMDLPMPIYFHVVSFGLLNAIPGHLQLHELDTGQ